MRALEDSLNQWEIYYISSDGDHTLFIKLSFLGEIIILFLYVDNIIVIGNDKEERMKLKKCLLKLFDIKVLRRLKYFLSIELAHNKEVILISQRKYIVYFLEET